MPPQSAAISRAACLAIVASAAEVYPKECMGSVCCNAYAKRPKITAAFPYQVARRKLQEVMSDSSTTFDKLFLTGPFAKLGDYHSHPFQGFEKIEPLAPSETDLSELSVGDIEIIVQVRRRRRKGNYWRTTTSGQVSIAWDRYRFLIGGFRKAEGTDEDGVPLYKKIRLRLA